MLQKALPGSHVSPTQVSSPVVEIPTRKLDVTQTRCYRESDIVAKLKDEDSLGIPRKESTHTSGTV